VSGRPPYRGFFEELALDERRLAEVAEHRYVVRGTTTELRPPVDWHMDEGNSLAWRFWFHTFQFLDIPLRLYAERGEVEYLRRALALALDWVRANPTGGASTADHAWYDMAVGVRAAFFAYLWEASCHEGVLVPDAHGALRASLETHAAWLSKPGNYRPHSNHGLYEDAGLFVLGSRCRELPDSEAWRELAEQRFLETLARHVDAEEGVHLEQSPAYQFYIRELLERLHTTTGIGGSRLARLIERMERAAEWMVLPDGSILPFGDTDRMDIPAFARRIGSPEGMAIMRNGGFAVVRHGASYLAVTSCFHVHAHKHADELSWVLFERGELVVGEAGRYGYHSEADPLRVYARSSHAHNTLTLDGESFPWQQSHPYGSGILAAGAGGGWYAVLGVNALLDPASHHRLFCYRPAEALIVVDDLTCEGVGSVARRVHAGETLCAQATGPASATLAGDSVQAVLRDWSGIPVAIDVVRGEEGERADGWTFPRDSRKVPVDVVSLGSAARNGLLVHSLAIDPTALEDVSAVRADSGYTVCATIDGARHRLGLELDGGRIRIRRERD